MKRLKKVLILSCGVLLFACKDGKATGANQNVGENKKVERKYKKAQDFTYTKWSIKDNDSLRRLFKEKFSSQELDIIVALNRVDKSTFHTQDTLVVPDKFDDDFLAYAPFPYTLEEAKEIKKLAVFSYPIQAYGLYENGELIKWGPTSLGSKEHLTPEGLYFTNWKGEEVISTADDEWILRWNFNIDNEQGIGWHQYNLPGYPASHSCLRLLEKDAKWMYDWGEEWILKDENTVEAKGTPVIVFGTFDFEGTKPWYHLASNSHANDIDTGSLNNLIGKYKNEIIKEQKNREEVLSKR